MAIHGRANEERGEEEDVERQDAGGTAHRTRGPQIKSAPGEKPAKAQAKETGSRCRGRRGVGEEEEAPEGGGDLQSWALPPGPLEEGGEGPRAEGERRRLRGYEGQLQS